MSRVTEGFRERAPTADGVRSNPGSTPGEPHLVERPPFSFALPGLGGCERGSGSDLLTGLQRGGGRIEEVNACAS